MCTNFEHVAKFAALVIREFLILHICCTVEISTTIGFETALQQAFGRVLDSKSRSQLHLSLSMICRMGRHREFFERHAANIYGPNLAVKDLDELFVVYVHCAVSFENLRSRSSCQTAAEACTAWGWNSQLVQWMRDWA